MAEGTPIGSLIVRIGADATDLIDGFSKAGKASDKFGKVVTATAAAAATAGAAILALVKSVANAGDELYKMSQRVGISVESLSALKYAGNLADVSLDQLGTGLKQLSKNMVDAQAGTGDAAAAFKAMGLSVSTAGGQLKGTEQMMLEVADKFAGMEDGAGKTALAMKIFGKAGADLIPFLNDGRAGIEAAKKEAERLGVVFSTEAAKAAQELNDNLTRLGAVAEGVKTKLGNELIPSVTELSQQMLDGIQIAGGFWNALLQFAGINPFRTVGGNIKALQGDLEELKNNKALLAGLTGYEAQLAKIDREISVTENRIKFLKQQQLRDAAALAKPDTLDARDMMARGPAKEKAKAPGLPDEKALRDREQREQEVRDAIRKANEEAERIELAQIARKNEELFRNEADALAARLALIDQEQAAEIERGERILEADGQAHSMKLLGLANALKTEEQLELEAHAKRLEQLATFSEAELEAMGGFHAVKESLETQHWDRMQSIERRAITSLEDFEKASWSRRAKHMASTIANMTAGLSQGSRKMFELNKIAGIAHVALETPQAVASAYKWGAAWGGPVVGAAMATLAGLAMVGQMNQIRSQQFGGGGGAAPSLAGSTPATPVSPVSSGTPQSAAGMLDRTMVVEGVTDSALFTGDRVRNLAVALLEYQKNGGKVLFAS